MLEDLTEIIASKLSKQSKPNMEAVNSIQHSFQSFKGILAKIEKQSDVLLRSEPCEHHESAFLHVKQTSIEKMKVLLRLPSLVRYLYTSSRT